MRERLRPYSEYRDSGQAWLGVVPAHWDLLKMKYLFSERVQKGFPDEPLLAATQTKGVVPKEEYESRTVLALKDLHLLKLVEPGDYVISLRSFQGGIEYAHYRGIISPAYTILRPSSLAHRNFFEFFFKSAGFVNSLSLFVTGIREGQNIDYEKLSRTPLPVPPLEEQIAIGQFLRSRLSKINRYICAKRRLIELLNEQRQAIIQQAVTRGLHPGVPLRVSHVRWLEEIPAHWNERPAKCFLREVDERSRSGEEELLSVSHITGVTPRSQKSITMFKAASYVGYKLCRADDLVINTMWAWMGALGVAKQTGIVSSSYAVYRPTNPDVFVSRYIDHLLRSKPYISEYICRSTGIRSSRLRLYPEQFLKIPLICPPYEDQRAIIEYIESETRHLDETIARTQRELELLREYRTRLIADVVTGKLDVRGVELEEVEDLVPLDEDAALEDELQDEDLEETEEDVDADD